MQKLFSNESGATAIEYGLIAALISVAIIGAVTALGENVSSTFDDVASEMEDAGDSSGDSSGS